EITVAGQVIQTFVQEDDGTFTITDVSGTGAKVSALQLNNTTGELVATWSQVPGVHTVANLTYMPHGREVLKTIGTPSQEDFRLMILDSDDMVGLKQGGIYQVGEDLQNARYVGFAADKFDDLKDKINGDSVDALTFDDRESSSIDEFDLPGFVHANLGKVYGIGNVTT
ncbi:MAG: hypothetical protein GY888_04910, partial [Planctomycetaceae bacterium]|nr:hypothetical protein [Planctomycetaceae bacterium]